GVLERAREIEIVGAGARHRDPHAVAVDVLDGLERRVRRYDVGALDHDIGRGEVDAGGAHRVDRQERDIPGALLQRVEYFAGGIEGDEFDRDGEALGQLARELR